MESCTSVKTHKFQWLKFTIKKGKVYVLLKKDVSKKFKWNYISVIMRQICFGKENSRYHVNRGRESRLNEFTFITFTVYLDLFLAACWSHEQNQDFANHFFFYVEFALVKGWLILILYFWSCMHYIVFLPSAPCGVLWSFAEPQKLWILNHELKLTLCLPVTLS